MLNQNQKIVGSNAKVTVDELDKATVFFRERIWEINEGKTNLEWERMELLDLQYKLRNQLNELNAKNNPSRMNVIIELECEQNQKVNLGLRYLVRNAGWAPSYDIIAKDISKGIRLKYNAKVFNNTGLDWKDVDLILSTANPYLTADAPEITTWYLIASKLNRGRRDHSLLGYFSSSPEVDSLSAYLDIDYEMEKIEELNKVSDDNELLDKPMEIFSGVVNVNENSAQNMVINLDELSAEFEISKKYSIPSNRKSYLVKIDEFEVNTSFEHLAVPKMDKDAFLIAKLSGWADLDLIDGPANVYYGDTFVGKSLVKTSVEDSIAISLGRDKDIKISRIKLDEYSNTKLLGSNKKEELSYEITVRNNRNIPIVMELKDQIPKSNYQDVVVNLLESSSGTLDETTGIITWKLTLGPGESSKRILTFSVKYPKSKEISLERKRTINAQYY